MTKSDFNGFHNSFNAYCEYAEKQENTPIAWVEWWDSLESGE